MEAVGAASGNLYSNKLVKYICVWTKIDDLKGLISSGIFVAIFFADPGAKDFHLSADQFLIVF